MNAGTMGRDEAVEVLAALVDFVCAEMRGLESKPKLKAAIATLRAQSPTEERRGLAEAWRDLAIANAAIVDEIREIVGLTGKPGNVVEAVRKLVALRDGEAKQPAPPSAPVGGEGPLSLLRAGHWREVYIGHRCMRLEVTYDYATWERLMAEVESALAQQPAAIGEEIMVNTAHDVFILPLQPSGLSSGPRFVVHVPAQPAAIAEPARCPHGVRLPHECRECADEIDATVAVAWAEREVQERPVAAQTATELAECRSTVAAVLALLERSLAVIQHDIDEIGGCDNSVGICCCELIHLADDIRAALAALGGERVDGRYPCPRGAECKGRDCPDCANFERPPGGKERG